MFKIITNLAFYVGQNYFVIDVETEESRMTASYFKKNNNIKIEDIKPYNTKQITRN